MNKNLLKCFSSGYLFQLMKEWEQMILEVENKEELRGAIATIKYELISRDFRIN